MLTPKLGLRYDRLGYFDCVNKKMVTVVLLLLGILPVECPHVALRKSKN